MITNIILPGLSGTIYAVSVPVTVGVNGVMFALQHHNVVSVSTDRKNEAVLVWKNKNGTAHGEYISSIGTVDTFTFKTKKELRAWLRDNLRYLLHTPVD